VDFPVEVEGEEVAEVQVPVDRHFIDEDKKRTKS
jgi:hypothetical protein